MRSNSHKPFLSRNFNIQVNNLNESEFLFFFNFDLVQYGNLSTHELVNALDLVINKAYQEYSRQTAVESRSYNFSGHDRLVTI